MATEQRPYIRRAGSMTAGVYELTSKRIGATKAKSWLAARLIMVDGMGLNEAMRVVKLRPGNHRAVYRHIWAIESSFRSLGICYTCGQPLPPV
jgi:hypothetical protein